MHKFNIFYSFWFLLFHTNLSSLPFSFLFLSLSLWPSQNSNEIKWSLICMHLQNIACAVFAIKGMEKRVAVVLVGVYVLPHWHQTVFWYGNGGQGKNGCSLRLCLDIGQGLYSLLSFFLSLLFSFYRFSYHVHVLFLALKSFLSTPPLLNIWCYNWSFLPAVTLALWTVH